MIGINQLRSVPTQPRVAYAIMVVTLALMFCTIFLTQSRTLPKCSKIVRSPRDVGARLLRFSARYH
jgi:hypothetical protein